LKVIQNSYNESQKETKKKIINKIDYDLNIVYDSIFK
jgi:hypothetical protein